VSISHLLGLALHRHLDLESTDKFGNTPLLLALFYCLMPELFRVVELLEEEGADFRAHNRFGEGCLHRFLRRLSACNNYRMSKRTRNRVVSILEKLIKKGCDPAEKNINGYTPVDAALSPTAWPLFCQALGSKQSGLDARDVITRACGAELCAENIHVEEEYERVLANRTSLSPSDFAIKLRVADDFPTEQPCCLCGAKAEPTNRAVPFDEFYSDVVDDFGQGIHMKFHDHKPGDKCMHVCKEDPSHYLDYPSPSTIRRDRSWKRHVAYLLWKRGKFRSPVEAQRWAVGLNPLLGSAGTGEKQAAVSIREVTAV
jgi:hypothetical protein